MKKILITCAAMAFLVACGNSDSGGSATETAGDKNAAADISKDPVYKEGLALVAKNNCFVCHKVDDKLTGPSYREVAAKYGSEDKSTIIPQLAEKIMKGGSGVWGVIPMTPHPQVSQQDAETMVKYILMLKK